MKRPLVLSAEDIRKYQKGASAAALAHRLGCHRDTVIEALKRQGVPVKTHKESCANRRTEESRRRLLKVASLRACNWSHRQIAEVIGVSHRRIAQLIQEAKEVLA